jgi:2-succinyl-6-hydroxy-2,4-cyclohexadiene-1-carboxylate synthase
MTTLTINGLRYFVHDEGTGPPLILLHGFTGSSAGWAPVMESLSGHHRVLAIDLPGHGRTDAPYESERYQMGNVAADIEKLLSTLCIGRAHLLGYSMGGRLALFLALRYPGLWQTLVLESASPGLADAAARHERASADDALADWIQEHPLADFVDCWESLPLFSSQKSLSPEVQASQRHERLANSRLGLANSLRGMGTGRQPSLWSELDRLRLPTLLLTGTLDVKFTDINWLMAAAIPGSRLVTVRNAGHTIHLEQPATFAEQVLQFLGGNEDEMTNKLTDTEQDNKRQRRQRHLLQPGVEGGQIGCPGDGLPITDQQGNGQQKQVFPQPAFREDDVQNG